MSAIVTPGQMSRLAECYHQLEQLLNAGIGLREALQAQKRGAFREPMAVLIQVLAEGHTFAEALQHTKKWFPEFDIALLEAGEQSGRLPSCFGLLADYYRERAHLLRQVLSNLAYPMFLFHFAIFIMPFPGFFQNGDVLQYLRSTFGILIPFYIIVAVMIFASQSRHAEWWRSIVESLTALVPILGGARRNLALARLAMALEALVTAGVSIVRAWPMAAAASGSPAIRRSVAGFKEPLENGTTPSELVERASPFPDLFADLYRTGEISGRLEEALQRIRTYYSEEGERHMRLFAQWVPRLIYVAVVIMIATHVISFYTAYFDRIGSVLE